MKDKRFFNLIQVILGMIFLVSGILKGVDVYGTSLKLIEYSHQTGFGFLEEYSRFLAISLCGMEIFIGLWMITFIYRKLATILLIAMTVSFTVSILYFIVNPDKMITDCGCFGELFPMTMNESLLKNIGIISLGIYSFWKIRHTRIEYNKHYNMFLVFIFTISISVPWFSSLDAGIINPTGYGEGVNLKEKDDFMILGDDFEDVTDSLLNESEKVYMLVLKDELTFKDSYRIKQIIKSCKQEKYVCFAVSNKNIGLPIGLNLYYTDETLLKSLVRSPHNGIVIMNNGVVDDVWVFENEY